MHKHTLTDNRGLSTLYLSPINQEKSRCKGKSSIQPLVPLIELVTCIFSVWSSPLFSYFASLLFVGCEHMWWLGVFLVCMQPNLVTRQQWCQWSTLEGTRRSHTEKLPISPLVWPVKTFILINPVFREKYRPSLSRLLVYTLLNTMMILYFAIKEVLIQLLETVELKWLKLAGCCELTSGNDRNCMSTLTLIEQPGRNWSVFCFSCFAGFCFLLQGSFELVYRLYVQHLKTHS